MKNKFMFNACVKCGSEDIKYDLRWLLRKGELIVYCNNFDPYVENSHSSVHVRLKVSRRGSNNWFFKNRERKLMSIQRLSGMIFDIICQVS